MWWNGGVVGLELVLLLLSDGDRTGVRANRAAEPGGRQWCSAVRAACRAKIDRRHRRTVEVVGDRCCLRLFGFAGNVLPDRSQEWLSHQCSHSLGERWRSIQFTFGCCFNMAVNHGPSRSLQRQTRTTMTKVVLLSVVTPEPLLPAFGAVLGPP